MLFKEIVDGRTDGRTDGRRTLKDHKSSLSTLCSGELKSYWPDKILLQVHVVTLTFKVATQLLRATRCLNMVIISVKYFRNPISNNKVMGRTRFCCKVMRPKSCARHILSTWWSFLYNSFEIQLQFFGGQNKRYFADLHSPGYIFLRKEFLALIVNIRQ